MKRRNVLMIAVSVLLIMFAAGCSKSDKESKQVSSGPVEEVRVGWLKSPDSMDPAKSNNSIGLALCYDPLFVFDSVKNEIVPYLAESYEYQDDTTLELTIKKGVTFSNGDELKASDVLYSLKRIVSPETGSPFAVYYGQYDLENSYIVDDYTLVLKYFKPYGPGIGAMSAMDDIVSEKFFSEVDAAGLWDKTCGTGAYICTENVSGSHSVYELRDDYWDTENMPEVKKFIVTTYSEVSTMLVDFENGDLDVMLGINDSTLKRLEDGKIKNASYKILPDFEQSYLMVPEYVSYFKDKRVRQAIALGVDWKSVALVAIGELGMPSTSVLSENTIPYYKNVGAYEYNPEKAAALLKEAGYSEGDIQLNVLAGNGPEEQRFFEAVQGYLSQIGINMKFECFETNTIIGRQASGETDLFLMGGRGAVTYPEPYMSLQKVDVNCPLKPCVITDPELTALHEAGLYTVDVEKRIEIYNKMQDWMKEECYWIPVYQQGGVVCWNNTIISDVQAATANRIDFNSVDLVSK